MTGRPVEPGARVEAIADSFCQTRELHSLSNEVWGVGLRQLEAWRRQVVKSAGLSIVIE